jgi:hypothetical protein
MKLLRLAALLGLITTVSAQSLRFTSGYTYDNLNIWLQLRGPTNRWIYVERLRHLTQTWQTLSTNWIDSTGYVSLGLTNAHDSGFYAILRARTTNDSHLATNGYGSVSGYLGQNYSLIGNPFATNWPPGTFRNPADGTIMYLHRNGNYTTAEYAAGEWIQAPTVNTCEGMLVYNPSTNALHYIASGIFVTNSFTYNLESPVDLICSPLFRIQAPLTNSVALTQRVDLLRTNLLGGLSNLPVTGSCTTNDVVDLFKLAGAAGPTYTEYNLGCNAASWTTTNGTWVNIPLYLSEGFWLGLTTNRVWTIPGRPLWY